VFRESVALKPAEASFRQGWKEVMAGETRPIADLWKGIDAEKIFLTKKRKSITFSHYPMKSLS